MRQNAVAPRPSQRNELISPRFQWAVFVHLGKGNDRVVAKYSIEGKRAGDLGEITKYSRVNDVFDQNARSSGYVENGLLFRTPNGTKQQGRSCARHDS
jgi:hypothetical protein